MLDKDLLETLKRVLKNSKRSLTMTNITKDRVKLFLKYSLKIKYYVVSKCIEKLPNFTKENTDVSPRNSGNSFQKSNFKGNKFTRLFG